MIYLNIIMMVLLLVMVLYMLFFMISYKLMYNMESSGYECGFNYITSTRIKFSYRFFLIGILFLIFDVEIVLMLFIPYLAGSEYGMMMMMMFVMILVLGLLYEYYCGSLEWVS